MLELIVWLWVACMLIIAVWIYSNWRSYGDDEHEQMMGEGKGDGED